MLRVSNIVAHAATYLGGFALMMVSALAEFHVAMPGVAVDNPEKTFCIGAGIVGAAWKADKAMSVAKAAIALAFVCLLAMSPLPASAQVVSKTPPPAASKVSCTPTGCTVFYAGGLFGGNGDNANLLGNGINGSINSGGFLAGADAGWQYDDGKVMFGLEADAIYQFQNNAVTSAASGSITGPFGLVQAKAGLALSSILPAQQPLSLSLPLTIITPYVAAGEVFGRINGGVGGAGIEFELSPTWFIDAEYLNGGSGGSGALSTKSNNFGFVKAQHAFSF